MEKTAKTTKTNRADKRRFGRKLLPWLGAGIAGLGLSLIPISSLIAQSYPNVFANPRYGTANLSLGFSPNPYSAGVTAGGWTDADMFNLGPNCTGYIATDQPDFRLNYSRNSNTTHPLVFTAQSNTDTTLLINDPNGNWYCDDDAAGNRNPRVTFNSPRTGQYNVWVGVYGSGSTAPANLQIEEQRPIVQNRTTFVNFCNQTANPIYTAYAAFEQNNGWRSHGWYRVEAQQCREVSLEREYRGNIYVYGEYNQGEQYWGGNDASFCIHRTSRFDIPNADQAPCNGSDWKRVSMRIFSVNPGQNTWTMTSGRTPDPSEPDGGNDPRDDQGGNGGNGSGSTCLVYIGDTCVLRL